MYRNGLKMTLAPILDVTNASEYFRVLSDIHYESAPF